MPSPSLEDPTTRLAQPPPGAWEPLTRLVRLAKRPLERFLLIEAASGILLLTVAAIALVWANSPWASTYASFWHARIGLRVGSFLFERNLEWFVNDCLMVVFFFVVGLEIRRELHDGELSDRRRAALPFAAAVGGMLAPALIYLSIAGEGPTHAGWGIPMATDIAFAVGVLTLLGKRVPAALRILLLALAVIDDLGAILVIALFYSSGLALMGLLPAAMGVSGILLLQILGVRHKSAYVLPALFVWGGTYALGVHPTIAGVVVGMLTPVKVWLGPKGFVEHVKINLESLSNSEQAVSPRDLKQALHQINVARREARSPAEALIELLHPWVAFLIMPVFALANAGVTLSGFSFDPSATRVIVGVGAGLVLGKPLGVLLACEVMVRLGWAARPTGITFKHLAVLGVVAGIGFTMALFVAQLAFADPRWMAAAKLGVLGGSGVAALLGFAIGALLFRRSSAPSTVPKQAI